MVDRGRPGSHFVVRFGRPWRGRRTPVEMLSRGRGLLSEPLYPHTYRLRMERGLPSTPAAERRAGGAAACQSLHVGRKEKKKRNEEHLERHAADRLMAHFSHPVSCTPSSAPAASSPARRALPSPLPARPAWPRPAAQEATCGARAAWPQLQHPPPPFPPPAAPTSRCPSPVTRCVRREKERARGDSERVV